MIQQQEQTVKEDLQEATADGPGDAWEPPTDQLAPGAMDFDPSMFERLPDGFGLDAPEAATRQKPKDTTPSHLRIRTAGELIRTHPKLRRSVIYDLLRQGETMNVISSPKVGKSWLVAGLSLAIVTGRQWLGYAVERGKVLLIDNELHQETLGYRIKKVGDALGIQEAEYADDLHIVTLRGCLTDINGLGRLLDSIAAGTYRLVVLDALYRAVPVGTDENSNSAIAQVYNRIDQYALAMDCGWVCVHHTSKGNQANKTITDVGSGAGSQSRAVDSHVILRPHVEAGCIVLEAAARSFPPVDPVGLRWEWPLWTVDRSLDPGALKLDKPRRVDKLAQVKDEILKAFVHYPEGATKRKLQERTGRPNCWNKALNELLDEGQVVACEVPSKVHSKPDAGFKRLYKDNDF